MKIKGTESKGVTEGVSLLERILEHQLSCNAFCVHGSMHRESMSIIVQQDVTISSLLYFCKLLYMFQVIPSPIIRSTYNL